MSHSESFHHHRQVSYAQGHGVVVVVDDVVEVVLDVVDDVVLDVVVLVVVLVVVELVVVLVLEVVVEVELVGGGGDGWSTHCEM